ncbi:MAG TPA: hypothetical protein VIV09_16775 [Pseudolabrys sp.]
MKKPKWKTVIELTVQLLLIVSSATIVQRGYDLWDKNTMLSVVLIAVGFLAMARILDYLKASWKEL